MTGSILTLGIGVPYALCLPKQGYMLVAIMIWALYARFAPCDEYYKDADRKGEARRQKFKTLVLLGIVLLLGYFMKDYWKMLVLCISLLQGLTLTEIRCMGKWKMIIEKRGGIKNEG